MANYDWYKPTNEQFCILIQSESLFKKEKAHKDIHYSIPWKSFCVPPSTTMCPKPVFLSIWPCLPLILNEPICWRFSRRSWPPSLKYWALLVHFLARPTLPRWQWLKHHCVNFTAWNMVLVIRTSKQESHSAVKPGKMVNPSWV